MKIKDKLKAIRKKAHNLEGSYEYAYIFLMNEIDNLIEDLD